MRAALVLALVVAAVERPAFGADESRASANLRYERDDGAESCAAESELRAAVAARLGYDPFVSREGADTIIAHVRRKGHHLEASVERLSEANGAPGKPTVLSSRSTDCRELGSSLAVALSVAIDPLSLTRAEPPAPPPPPAPLLSSSSVAPAPREKATERTNEPPTQLLVSAGASLASGALPSTAFGVRASAGVVHGAFEVSVEGRFDPPVRLRDRGGAVEASIALVGLVPCLRYRVAVVCAQASVGAMRGTGLGFDHTHEANTFYAATGARLGMDLPLGGGISARAFLEGQVALRPTSLEVDGASVWSTPPFALAFVPMIAGRLP